MATVYNDKIYGQKVLQQLNSLLLPIRAFTTDISDELKSAGDAVVVPLYGNTTTTTFTQASDVMEQTGGLISAVTVTLDKRRITPIDLTHQQMLEATAAGRPERFTTQLAKSIAKTVLLDIMSVITTTNFGTAVTTVSSASWARAQLIEARKAALDAGVMDGEISLVMNRSIESALLGVSELTLALNRGNDTAINQGNLGNIFGVDLYASSIFPTNSVSLNAFVCGKDAIAVAFRRIADELPAGEFEAMEEIVDDETGLSLLYTRHWSRAQAKWFINMHCLYGYSKAVTLALRPFCTTNS
jgi:hypothetical protein